MRWDRSGVSAGNSARAIEAHNRILTDLLILLFKTPLWCKTEVQTSFFFLSGSGQHVRLGTHGLLAFWRHGNSAVKEPYGQQTLSVLFLILGSKKASLPAWCAAQPASPAQTRSIDHSFREHNGLFLTTTGQLFSVP